MRKAARTQDLIANKEAVCKVAHARTLDDDGAQRGKRVHQLPHLCVCVCVRARARVRVHVPAGG